MPEHRPAADEPGPTRARRRGAGTRLALVRHGQSTWNALSRWQGQANPPLSPLGEEQAAEAAERLAGTGVTGVVTSDLIRARRTGQIVADALGLGPVRVHPDLGEYDVGDWSGLTKPEIEKRWPGQQAEWFGGRLPTTPGGEGRIPFDRRVMRAVLEVSAEAAAGVGAGGDHPRRGHPGPRTGRGGAAGAHRQPLRALVLGGRRAAAGGRAPHPGGHRPPHRLPLRLATY